MCAAAETSPLPNFCYGKDKNVTDEQKADGAGSAWMWIALDADSKLVVAYLTGGRDAKLGARFHVRRGR